LNNHIETAKVLVQEGADMLLKNVAGRDAIWEAEQRGNEELVGWMLGFGEEKEAGEVTMEDVEEDGENGGIELNGEVVDGAEGKVQANGDVPTKHSDQVIE
jgi:hypothetical protein